MGRKGKAVQAELVPLEEKGLVVVLAYLREFLTLISTESDAIAHSTIYSPHFIECPIE